MPTEMTARKAPNGSPPLPVWAPFAPTASIPVRRVLSSYPVDAVSPPDVGFLDQLGSAGAIIALGSTGFTKVTVPFAGTRKSAAQAWDAGTIVWTLLGNTAPQESGHVWEELLHTSQSLVEWSRLDDDWNGENAARPHPVAIASAYDLVLRVCHKQCRLGNLGAPEMVAPIPDGGIYLEWQGPKRRASIQVAPDGSFGFLLVGGEPGAREYKEADNLDLASILAVIESVLQEK